MGFKKITYSLPALKTLLETKNSCVFCIENCRRSLTVLPAQLSNLKSSVNEYLSSKVTTCDPELQGIILSHKNIKVVDSVQLNDDGNYRLDYVADTYIFKPTVGSLLTGIVNKKSADHLGVLVHSVFNATIPRPRVDNGCPKAWAGAGVKIGQQVTFEVVKVNFSSRLPYIKGKLIEINEKYNEDCDSGIGGHDSMEESSSSKSNVGKLIDVNENVSKKKKKKKKHSLAEEEEHCFSVNRNETTMSNLHKKNNSSNLMDIESALLNEAIASVNDNKSEHSANKKEQKSLCSPQSSPLNEGKHASSSRKRKRDTSSLVLNNSVNDPSIDVPIASSSYHDEQPKVKKKKLSKSFMNGLEGSLLDEKKIDFNKAEGNVESKHKESPDDSASEGKTIPVTDVQSTIDDLLSIANASFKPKKKKKRKSSISKSDLSSLNYSSELLNPLYTNKEVSPSLEKLKKKKKSFDLVEDTMISETESHISEPLTESESQWKKEKKKKKKSFLQMETDCIDELISSLHPNETNASSENKSPLEKKKKKKYSNSGSPLPVIEPNEMNISDMLSPNNKRKKKKKSSVSFMEE